MERKGMHIKLGRSAANTKIWIDGTDVSRNIIRMVITVDRNDPSTLGLTKVELTGMLGDDDPLTFKGYLIPEED